METQLNRNATNETTSQKKCGLCRNPGHNIMTCNHRDSNNMFELYKQNFTDLMKQRLLDSKYADTIGFQNLIYTISNNTKNVLKYLARISGKDSLDIYPNLPTVRQLHCKIVYHLFRIFKLKNNMRIYSEKNRKLFDVEKLYFSRLSNGNSISDSYRLMNREKSLIKQHYDNENKFPIQIHYVERNNETEQFDCSICLEIRYISDQVCLDCSHTYCGICIEQSLSFNANANKTPSCALCRHNYETITLNNHELENRIKLYCR